MNIHGDDCNGRESLISYAMEGGERRREGGDRGGGGGLGLDN